MIYENDSPSQPVGKEEETINLQTDIRHEENMILLTGEFDELRRFLIALDEITNMSMMKEWLLTNETLQAARSYTEGHINKRALQRIWHDQSLQMTFGTHRVHLVPISEDTEKGHLALYYQFNDCGDPEQLRNQNFQEIQDTCHRIVGS